MSLVKRPVLKVSMRKKNYNTDDIVELVEEVLNSDVDDTEGLAKTYMATRQGLHQLYRDVYNRITYVEDPSFHQWVQTPSYLWHHTKRGDCKSLTVFISSVLQNMGIPHYIRYVSYDFRSYIPRSNKKFKHVYPVAILNGQELPLDVVFEKQEGGQFGTEKRYFLKKDTLVEAGLYKLGSVSQSEQQYMDNVSASIAEMEAALSDIPDDIVNSGDGDITQMNEGQLERSIMKDRYTIYADQEALPSRAAQYRDAAIAMERGTISGLYGLQTDAFGRQVEEILRRTEGKTAAAFDDFKLRLKAPNDAINGLFKKVGGFFKKVGNAFSKLFKKFVNWVWKGPAKLMGPFYIFLFAKKHLIKSKKIRNRIKAQEKSFDFIAKKGKFSKDKLMGVMLNGIKAKTGKTPKEIYGLAGRDVSKIGAFPAIFLSIGKWVIKAIGWVVKIVQKIAGLFKKKKSDAGVIDQTTMSDLSLLEEEAMLQMEKDKSKPMSSQGKGSGSTEGDKGSGGLAWLALGIPLLLKVM